MLKIIASLVLVISLNAGAEEKKEKSQESIAEIKTRLTQNLDKRISQLQETKACVSAAQDKEALKSCRERSKEQRQALHKEWKEFKENRKKK